jgi:flagellin-like hook-associated protein FlgL
VSTDAAKNITEDVLTTILGNVPALAASRQLGVSQLGLNQALTRLTTGRRINTAADDSVALAAGNLAQASQRSYEAMVAGDNAIYFQAVAADGIEAQNTQLAYRMAEIEGSGDNRNVEYKVYVENPSLGGNSDLALAAIAARQVSNAAIMSAALSNAQLDGINAETQQGIADAWLGADMGAEMAHLTKYQILMQAGTSALNNANQSAQSVLSLFR